MKTAPCCGSFLGAWHPRQYAHGCSRIVVERLCKCGYTIDAIAVAVRSFAAFADSGYELVALEVANANKRGEAAGWLPSDFDVRELGPTPV